MFYSLIKIILFTFGSWTGTSLALTPTQSPSTALVPLKNADHHLYHQIFYQTCQPFLNLNDCSSNANMMDERTVQDCKTIVLLYLLKFFQHCFHFISISLNLSTSFPHFLSVAHFSMRTSAGMMNISSSCSPWYPLQSRLKVFPMIFRINYLYERRPVNTLMTSYRNQKRLSFFFHRMKTSRVHCPDLNFFSLVWFSFCSFFRNWQSPEWVHIPSPNPYRFGLQGDRHIQADCISNLIYK